MAQDFQDFVEEVRERNDIVEVISEYTKLKRVGNRYAALCPLHNDKKSPSLSVAPDQQLFHCFGCGVGGTVIHFIMAAENLEFYDALKYLADRAHLTMPERGTPADRKKREEMADRRQMIYQINAEAARYFYRQLAAPSGREAHQYLQKREIQNSTIKRFGLGYAPEGWTGLLDFLKEKGYREHDVYEAGLARLRDNGTYYDVFHDGRVIFPIINVQGNIIGFGGRALHDGGNGPKYLNSPETVVFKKKENLFGLNLAKNDKSGQMLLMEGYMDVIALHQAGIGNAVASLGTAFTEEQARLLKKYAGKAVLCYDSDQAGQKATLRAGEILSQAEIKTRVLTLTDGKDPDEFIKARGPEMFQVLVEQAKPLLTYRIDRVKQDYNLEDTEQTIEFIERAAAILAEIAKPAERELYLKQVAMAAGISRENLEAQVNLLRRTRQSVEERKQERQERRDFEARTGGRRDLQAMGRWNAERLLLNMMTEAAVLKRVREVGLTAEDFAEGLHRDLAEKLLAREDGRDVDPYSLLAEFPAESAGTVTAILMDDKNIENKSKACSQPIGLLLEEKAKRQQARLMEQDDLAELDKMLKNQKGKGGRDGGTRKETGRK